MKIEIKDGITAELTIVRDDGGVVKVDLSLAKARELRDGIHAALTAEAEKQAHAFYDFPDLHLQFTDNKEEWPDDDSMWGPDRLFTLSGCLPGAYPSHYDVEDRLIEAKILERKNCDSESGCLFLYANTKEELTKAAEFIRTLAR